MHNANKISKAATKYKRLFAHLHADEKQVADFFC